MYEPGLILVPLAFLAWIREGSRQGPRRRWAAFAGYAAVSLGYVAAAAFVRHRYGANYSGTQGGFSRWALWAFVCQSSAALPLIYEFFGKAGLFHLPDLWGPGFVAWQTPVLALFAAWGFHALLAGVTDEPSAPSIFRPIGWFLWLAPSLLIAASSRYQLEVDRPGLGYLPVFFAYFGVALLLGDFVPRWVARGRRPESRRWKAALVLAALTVFGFNGNRLAARALNHQRMEHREVIRVALEAGLFSELPENATVLFDETSGWLSPEFVIQYAHRRVTLVYREHGREPGQKPGKRLSDLLNPGASPPYYLRAEDHPDGSGWVMLGRVDEDREGALISRDALIARVSPKGTAMLQTIGSPARSVDMLGTSSG
jgi:hypothetical protein